MPRTRRMLVATVLTTALITGAARGAEAAPATRPNTPSVARRLAAKLVVSLRQVLPAARLVSLRLTDDAAVAAAILPASIAPPTAPFETAPSLYPLPPPNL